MGLSHIPHCPVPVCRVMFCWSSHPPGLPLLRPLLPRRQRLWPMPRQPSAPSHRARLPLMHNWRRCRVRLLIIRTPRRSKRSLPTWSLHSKRLVATLSNRRVGGMQHNSLAMLDEGGAWSCHSSRDGRPGMLIIMCGSSTIPPLPSRPRHNFTKAVMWKCGWRYRGTAASMYGQQRWLMHIRSSLCACAAA